MDNPIVQQILAAMKSRLMKQIMAASGLAIFVAVFASVYGDFLYQPNSIDKPAYNFAAGGKKAGGDSEAKKSSGPEPILELLAAADLDKGAKLAKKKCMACHTVDEGGKHKAGPNLYAVVGRAKGTADGFGGYSAALQEFGGDWSYEDLNKFLFKPKAFIKGTKMGFAGFKKTEDRANVIAYLRSLAAEPQPLP